MTTPRFVNITNEKKNDRKTPADVFWQTGYHEARNSETRTAGRWGETREARKSEKFLSIRTFGLIRLLILSMTSLPHPHPKLLTAQSRLDQLKLPCRNIRSLTRPIEPPPAGTHSKPPRHLHNGHNGAVSARGADLCPSRRPRSQEASHPSHPPPTAPAETTLIPY